MQSMDGTTAAERTNACDAVESMVRRVQSELGGPSGIGRTDLQWALRTALSEAGAASEVVGRGWVPKSDGQPRSIAIEAGDGTYDHRGRVMRHQLDFEAGWDRAPARPDWLEPGRHGAALLEAFRAAMAETPPPEGWAAVGRPPKDGLQERLTAMLAEVVSTTLDTVTVPGSGVEIDRNLANYRPDLVDRAYALLGEAGA